MKDDIYCYPGTNILINKQNIRDEHELFLVEIDIASFRLTQLQCDSITGNFDFKHLQDIHKYIFQDIFDWAGNIRTVEIGKGNLFCLVKHIPTYADSVFKNYYPQCWEAKDDIQKFIRVLAENYGNLNALHPFREGNGRAQREFARQVCLSCGYDFDLSHTTHKAMLEASILNWRTGDIFGFVKIFSQAVIPVNKMMKKKDYIDILTMDDLSLEQS